MDTLWNDHDIPVAVTRHDRSGTALAWHAGRVQCSAEEWHAPHASTTGFNPTGYDGNDAPGLYAQCRECGRTYSPAYVVRDIDTDTAALVDEVRGMVREHREWVRDGIRDNLADMLRHYVATGEGAQLNPTEPGVYAEGGDVVAWCYDPYNGDEGYMVEVTPADL